MGGVLGSAAVVLTSCPLVSQGDAERGMREGDLCVTNIADLGGLPGASPVMLVSLSSPQVHIVCGSLRTELGKTAVKDPSYALVPACHLNLSVVEGHVWDGIVWCSKCPAQCFCGCCMHGAVSS